MFAPCVSAQKPLPAAPNTPSIEGRQGQYKINVNVNLVVLHVTVLDKHQHFVNELTAKDFRVFENGIPQKLAVFSHADIPVTMGIVIDDSGSMRDKRPSVNTAAITFVKTSNPYDQVFVVNFNDNYYLDTPGEFASNMEDLRAALAKIDSRGGTALRDAVYASLDHLRLGNHDKKVLLVITDGDDNESRYSQAELIQHEEQSNAVVYTIGLLGGEGTHHSLFHLGHDEDYRAAKALKEMAAASGGKAYFPKTLDEVESTCVQIAHDIRNQYTLGYYPTNAKKDGTFRLVRVEALNPSNRARLVVRTKPGYYAPKATGTPVSVAAGQ